MGGFATLQEEVIGVGLCTDCGLCVGVCPNKSIVMNYEMERPESIRQCPEKCHLCKQACKEACPIHTDVRGYLALIARGEFQEAYGLIRKDNPLPAVCGRVCHHPCEEACNRGQVDDAMAIAALKRFASDQVDVGKLEIPRIVRIGKRVSVIGSGPAGLAAANDLALLGYDVTIFEALPEPGGMLRVGLPQYRLPKDLLRKEIGYIERLGVRIKTSTKVGQQVSLEDLRESYQAIFVAAGAHQSIKLGVPGEDTPGVIQGLDFLRDVNMGRKIKVGKHVVVIGGGNVAIDVARTVLRLGAREVQLACLESREVMPAFKWEIKEALDEGIILNVSWGPKRIVGTGKKVEGVELVRCTSVFDNEGKFSPSFDESVTTFIPAHMVIVAIGQAPDLSLLGEDSGIQSTKQGLIVVDDNTLETHVSGIFAGGDSVTGPRSVIDAIAAGKRAARYIHRYLKGGPLIGEEAQVAPEKLSDEEVLDITKRITSQSRVKMTQLDLEERKKGFREVEQGYSFEEAQKESWRCLSAQDEEHCYAVCPGKDIPMPELERFIFGRERNADEEFTGVTQTFVAAHATDPLIRIGSASGGLVSALLIYALENDIIDAAIVCGTSTEQPWRVMPKIAITKEEVLAAAQSKLSVSPNCSLLGEVVERGYKRVGFVGSPCHVEGIRKMQMSGKPKKIVDSMKFIIGLCCGSNWSHKSVEHVIEEICGVPLGQVDKWQVRDGAYPGLWTVYTKDGRRIVLPDSGRRTYAMAFLKERCSVCCDYSSELADVTAGDYFAPHMVAGVPGETACIIRTDVGRRLIEGAEVAKHIKTEHIEKDYLFWGGWELKKHGNPYRILERRKFGHAAPDYHWPLVYPSPMPRKTTSHPHL